MMKPLVILAVAALVLSACGTRQERARQAALDDDLWCSSLGFDRASQGYAECRLIAAQQRAAEEARNDAMVVSGLTMMHQAGQPPPAPTSPFRTYTFGDSTVTCTQLTPTHLVCP